MNKNFVTVLIILLLLIMGGVLVYSFVGNDDVSINDTSTSEENLSDEGEDSVLPRATAPLVVTSSTVSTSANTAMVNGTVNPKGAFSSYWFEYGKTSTMGIKTPNQFIGSGFVEINTPAYLIGLSKNTTYYFRLVSENQYGKVVGNQFSFKTSENLPFPVGSVPTAKTISANNISSVSAEIHGEVTPNSATTLYWFEYGKTAQLGNTSAFSSAGNGTNKTSVSISLSDLEPLTTYYFRLNAQNQFGTINGSILNFKTNNSTVTVVPRVISQNVTSLTKSSATVHGTVNPGGVETKYWFEYSSSPLSGSSEIETTSKITLGLGRNTSSVKADISGLDSSTNYYFRLVAENSLGTVRGDEIAFKTK